jgi:hypothetical protein
MPRLRYFCTFSVEVFTAKGSVRKVSLKPIYLYVSRGCGKPYNVSASCPRGTTGGCIRLPKETCLVLACMCGRASTGAISTCLLPRFCTALVRLAKLLAFRCSWSANRGSPTTSMLRFVFKEEERKVPLKSGTSGFNISEYSDPRTRT